MKNNPCLSNTQSLSTRTRWQMSPRQRQTARSVPVPVALALALVAARAAFGFGEAILGVDDLNGDGVPDFVVGDSSWNNYAGRVQLYSGADWSLLATVEGGDSGDRFGHSLCAAGDWTGDGFAELAIGAPRSGTEIDAGTEGVVVVYDLRNNQSIASFTYPSDEATAIRAFGATIQGGTDLDGDGFPDLLIGAPRSDALDQLVFVSCEMQKVPASDAGAVFFVSGASRSISLVFRGARFVAKVGTTIHTLPDLTNDGRPEIFLNGPGTPVCSDHVECSTCYGGDQAILEGFDFTELDLGLLGSPIGMWSMATQTSVMNDGQRKPFLVATGNQGRSVDYDGKHVQNYPDTCQLWSLDGGAGGGSPFQLELEIEGEFLFDDFSKAITFVGDVDGDGMDDLAIGAPRNAGPQQSLFLFLPGAVYVYSSVTGQLMWQFNDPESGALLGSALARVYDVDGDGADDFAASSPGKDRVIIFSSRSGAVLAVIGNPLPPPPPLPCTEVADFNQSGIVDAADLAIILSAWGSSDAAIDLNGDGVVNGADIATLLVQWGPCDLGG